MFNNYVWVVVFCDCNLYVFVKLVIEFIIEYIMFGVIGIIIWVVVVKIDDEGCIFDCL